MTLRLFVLICTLCANSALTAQQSNRKAAAWEFLRGGNFDGRSEEIDLIDEWPADGPPVLWNRKLGQGYSGFTGRDDRMFTQYQSVTTQYVICLDANTGETIWEYSIGWSHRPAGLYPGPRSTPTLDGDLLFFTSPDGDLGCLEQSSGEKVWQLNLLETFDAEPVEFGYSISPTIVDEKVLVPVGGPDASIVAIDKNNGSLIWKSQGGSISHAELLPIEKDGKSLIVGYLKNSLVLLDLNTGEKLADHALSEGYDEHSAWPIYKEPHLWISAPFRRGSELFEITSDSPPKLERLRQSYDMSNDVCSSVLVDDTIFGFDIIDVQSKVHRTSRGHFRAIDFKSGEVLWTNGSKRRVPAPGDIGHAAMIHADGKLILLNDSGELIVGKVDRNGFHEIGRAKVLGGDICWTQPTLLNGRLFLRNHKRAVCVFLGNPDSLNVSVDQLTRTSDIRQPFSLDWARLIFSVEPEYAMDAPEAGWLVNWYIAILLTGCVVSWALAIVLLSGWKFFYPTLRYIPTVWYKRRNNVGAGQTKLSTPDLRRSFRAARRWIGAVLGILGTTLISGWHGDFIFTWPLTVFILFEVCIYHAALKRGDTADRVWAGRIALVAFFATLAAYYFLCRRLSLAFEWAFLTGFPFSVPFLLLARQQSKQNTLMAIVLEWIWQAIALSVFYWAGAGLILWKY